MTDDRLVNALRTWFSEEFSGLEPPPRLRASVTSIPDVVPSERLGWARIAPLPRGARLFLVAAVLLALLGFGIAVAGRWNASDERALLSFPDGFACVALDRAVTRHGLAPGSMRTEPDEVDPSHDVVVCHNNDWDDSLARRHAMFWLRATSEDQARAILEGASRAGRAPWLPPDSEIDTRVDQWVAVGGGIWAGRGVEVDRGPFLILAVSSGPYLFTVTGPDRSLTAEWIAHELGVPKRIPTVDWSRLP